VPTTPRFLDNASTSRRRSEDGHLLGITIDLLVLTSRANP